jgi:putative ABC transport system permease protein
MFAPAKVTGIEEYMKQAFTSTILQFESVTLAVSALAIAIAMLITGLFLKMMLAKDRNQITIMKGLGFNSRHIRKQYISASMLCLIAGLVIGTILANTLGEVLAGALLSGMGASKISFVIDPLISFIVCPVLFLIAVAAAALISARGVDRLGNYIISE